ncbi:MAG: alpha/beta fold hydrolase [Caulobacter sp.]|nr:alpha/beta fold hydrolase [Caulobacter sp.]
MRKGWLLFLAGWALILGGAALASAIQTSGGIKIRDVRFLGESGVTMSGLLYLPPNATPETPAPGVLAVHGYINSRETQSGFAIEFARRGYVVLALDQTGHGYSGGPAFSHGFGGPDGLAFLRRQPMVDAANIGLEGHSMGGWTVLAAAAAMPDAYRAVVLQGSSTGAPFAAEGTPTWPRNLALVFSRYDEFGKFMWGVDNAADVGSSPKAKALFGANEAIEPGRLYGDMSAGTARVLHDPPVTHPGDHISHRAIGHSLDWFSRTLKGGTPRPAGDQIWFWKEVGTGLALVGFVVLLLGTFDLLLRLTVLSSLHQPAHPARERRTFGWLVMLALTALVPVITFFPAFIAVTLLMPPSGLFKQTISNQVMVWALVNLVLALLIGLFSRHKGEAPRPRWLPAALAAVATVGVGYLSLLVVDRLFTVDFRFWVVALKLFSPHQAMTALVYVLPLTLFFLVALRGLSRLTVQGDGAGAQYGWAVTAMAGGFALMLAVIYGLLFATGRLVTGFDPLSTVVAIQFVPLLAAVAVIATFTWRRTGSAVPGALICGLLVTWYVVAGTATQVL